MVIQMRTFVFANICLFYHIVFSGHVSFRLRSILYKISATPCLSLAINIHIYLKSLCQLLIEFSKQIFQNVHHNELLTPFSVGFDYFNN